MAFAGAFTVSQGSDISQFTLTDSSTDFDTNITTRTVYLYKVGGSILGGVAIDWPKDAGIGDTITIDVLDKDYSLSVVVVWEVPSPESGGVYTKTEIVTFIAYSNTFIYGIVQQMAADPSIVNSTNFLQSLGSVITFVDSAVISTNFSDQYNAQSNLDRVYYMQQKQELYF